MLLLAIAAVMFMIHAKRRAMAVATIAAFIPAELLLVLNSLEGETREFWMNATPLIVGRSIVFTAVSLGLGAGLEALMPKKKKKK